MQISLHKMDFGPGFSSLLKNGLRTFMVSKGGAVLRALPFHQTRRRRHILVEFVVGFLLCYQRFSSEYYYCSPQKQIFKIPIQLGMDDEEPLSGFPTS